MDASGGRPAPSICTIGDLLLDVVVLPAGSLVADGDTPATIRLCPGGQAANVAAWAAALGARSRLICARGSDLASQAAAAELRARGVEICGPVVDGLGGAVVSVREPDGRRTMASDRGAALRLRAVDLDLEWARSCDVLHVSGYCLLRPSLAEAAIAAAGAARRVTVDLASAPDIERLGPELFVRRLAALRPRLAFATEAERAAVPGFDCDWVIKRGALGASFPEGCHAAPRVEAVDTTGAGDALAAGYLVGGPELAIEAAGRCVTRVGAMPPSRAQPAWPSASSDANRSSASGGM